MDKIAIFGGTFNPVHNGHINLCNECQRIYNFNKILLIPTNIPPHKKALNLASNLDRYNMLNLAVKGQNNLEVSDTEFKLGEKSYTINTILKLKHQYANSDFHLIVGSDMLKMFDKWYRYKDILREVTLIVGARHNAEFEELLKLKSSFGSLSNKIDIVNIDIVEVSSTQIRDKVYNNESILNLVNTDVAEYIINNNLYK